MEGHGRQQHLEQPLWQEESTMTEAFWLSSLIPKVIISGLLMTIAYVWLSDRERRQREFTSSSSAISAKDQVEATRLRLQRLEQQSQKPQPKNNEEEKPSSAEKPGKLPTATKKDDQNKPVTPITTKVKPKALSESFRNVETHSKSFAATSSKAKSVSPLLPQPQPPSLSPSPTMKPKKTKLPRDIFLLAMSDITGYKYTVTLSSENLRADNKNSQCIYIANNLLPPNATWKDILQFSTAASDGISFFSDLMSQLQFQISTKQSNYVAIGITTPISDSIVWKAAEWYQNSRTWCREHSTFLVTTAATTSNENNNNDDDDGNDEKKKTLATNTPLSEILEQFRREIVITLVTQWKQDIEKDFQYFLQDDTVSSKYSAENDNDDGDDDVDLGLFADESYGGTVDTNDFLTTSNNKSCGGGGGSSSEDDTSFGEFLRLLGSVAAPKVLNRIFMDDIIRVYNNKVDNLSLEKILLKEFMQRLPDPESKSTLQWEAIQRDLTALSNLLTLSSHAVQVLVENLFSSSGELPTVGVAWETQAMLRPLFALVAISVPRLSKSSSRDRAIYDNFLPASFHATMASTIGPLYPVCLYSQEGYRAEITNYQATIVRTRNIMKHARTVGALALKRIAATSGPEHMDLRKGGIFDWIGHILESNEALVDLLEIDLLSPESAQALCASRPFLLGLATSLLEMCSGSLSSKLESAGKDSFDFRYFKREGCGDTGGGSVSKVGLIVPPKERFLVSGIKYSANGEAIMSRDTARFSGATELFFLTAALLRLGLFQCVRVVEDFRSKLRRIFSGIQNLAAKQPSEEQLRGNRAVMDQFQKFSSVDLGWIAFVDDPELSSMITCFCLMQLKWVALVATNNEALLHIPEWFVKLPSQWLAHVAAHTPHLLQPSQVEAAVKFATQILQVGTAQSATDMSKQMFSPPVLCELIRIAGSFIREGVRRARKKEQQRTRRRKTDTEEQLDFELDVIDDRTLDVYRSFDARDLGVTVFTNPFVATQLCRILMRAYMAMDAVEGMDVEREHLFEKFRVKHEVVDMLLYLWSHPNGESRNTILAHFDDVAMNEFSSSVAKTLLFQLDQSCQFILDIRDIKSAHEERFRSMHEIPPLPPQDEAAIDHHTGFLSFSLFQCRRLLMILCKFSLEEKIAASLGGNRDSIGEEISGKVAVRDLASMFVNLMDRFTAEDGGLDPELEMKPIPKDERSAEILSSLQGVNFPQVIADKLHYLLYSRRFMLLQYGFDASLMAHQFFALAARWHSAAGIVGKDGNRTSPFLEAVAKNDLCDIQHLRNVFIRLVGAPQEMRGSLIDNASYILKRDGYVDTTIWKESFNDIVKGPNSERHMNTAKQDRMSHDELEQLSKTKDIASFLDDLEYALSAKKTMTVAGKWGEKSMTCLEATILEQGEVINDEVYTELLQEWVVSSEAFQSQSGNGFAHAYDSIVRGRSVDGIGLGKVLVKEARKCKRRLPAPHPNTSVFVCFAEERTDLCKAAIIGAAETPFSMGMFEFDILFPADYPNSPPLFHFNTTGDGRTRISSNLYNDGKVCISILGTYQAFDDSQRWDPSTSSLAQVLASIQTQLLGDSEPYFSDGFNHDSVRGTPAGDVGSLRFNNKIRLHTLRHAMIDYLKHPPLGFEEVTMRHFATCRKRILTQAMRWASEAQGTPLFRSFTRAYEELATLLSAKNLVFYKLPGRDGSPALPCGAVRPEKTDLEALVSANPDFLKSHQQAFNAGAEMVEETTKRAVVEDLNNLSAIEGDDGVDNSASAQLVANFNPWAGMGNVTASTISMPSEHFDDDDDDDFYT